MGVVVPFLLWLVLVLGAVSLVPYLGRVFGKGYYMASYAGLTIVANIIAVKLIGLGRFIVPSAVIVYSATFLITDIADELYGRKFAHQVVMAGFVANVLAAISIWIAVKMPGLPLQEDLDRMFSSVLGPVPRIFLASVVAYLISQNHDVWAFAFWKEKTGGKYLWLRNNLSTAVSQLIDTVIFITLAYGGVFPWSVIGSMIVSQYAVKVLIALVDTPFCYLGVRFGSPAV